MEGWTEISRRSGEDGWINGETALTEKEGYSSANRGEDETEPISEGGGLSEEGEEKRQVNEALLTFWVSKVDYSAFQKPSIQAS